MNKKIAVLGAGAIGGSVSADLTDAGLDVTVIDQWPEHVEVMREKGLHVQMPDLDLKTPPLRAHHLCELASLRTTFDIVLLIVKSYDTRWMCELITALPEERRGIRRRPEQHEQRGDRVGHRARARGGLLRGAFGGDIHARPHPAEHPAQGHLVRRGGTGRIGHPARGRRCATSSRHVAVTELSTNIEGTKWTKLIANCMTMGPFGLLGLKNAETRELPGVIDLSVGLGKEAMAVGEALGYGVEPVFGLSSDDFTGSDRSGARHGHEDAARPRGAPFAHRADSGPHQGPEERDGIHQRTRLAPGERTRHPPPPTTTR